ncbi:MAG: hypothetical protein AUK55_07430 [Syntrophobacteraceae bacterium CG2_30_61_12]|nr:MAG: hypothetical protein AUK55_07430 [Syntrophobacteraceae bacterium CG2_30_61_12]
MKRRFLWVLVGLLPAVIASAVLLVHLPWVQQRLLERLADRIQQRFGLHWRLQGYRLWPPGQLTLRGLHINYAGVPVLICDTVRLEGAIEPAPPFLRLARVVLERPELRLEQDRDGRWRLPSAVLPALAGAGAVAPSPSIQPGTVVRFPPLSLENGRILAIRGDGSTFSVQGVTGTLQVTVTFDAEGKPDFQLRLGPARGFP